MADRSARSTCANVQQIYLLPIFNLTYTENNGISLGLFNATTDTGRWMLVGGDRRDRHRRRGVDRRARSSAGDQVALGMVLGGALGNILDRVRFGYVVDFADLHFGDFRPFLVFNVADAAISIGVVILLLRAFLVRNEQPRGECRKCVRAVILVLIPAIALGGCALLGGRGRRRTNLPSPATRRW